MLYFSDLVFSRKLSKAEVCPNKTDWKQTADKFEEGPVEEQLLCITINKINDLWII